MRQDGRLVFTDTEEHRINQLVRRILAAMDGGAHSHVIDNVTGLQGNLDLKAPLASPALTGVPTAPTAPAATNTTQIATTAFVLANAGVVGDGDKGDVTVTSSGTIWSIDNNSVSNAKMADVGTATLKGRVTAATGDPEDLTGTQATTLLDTFTSALKGLAPASGGGTTNYLRADGTWVAPPGGGGVTDGDKGDISVTGAGATWTIDNDVVSNAKASDMAVNTIKGRITSGTGDPEDLTATNVRTIINVADGANNYSHPNHSGDITSTGDGATTIAGDAVTNAKLANVPTATFKGRTTAATGDPEDLTVAQAKTLLNLTGTNSGDQTITLTSDVTGSGTGSFATTIASNAVSNSKMADVPTATFKGRTTAATGDPEDLTVAQAKTLLNLTGTNNGDQTITLTGDVTGSGTGSFAATVGTDVVTNTKLANIATNTIKGRITAATGDPEDLTAANVRTIINVADGATANSSDATLLARANHTGTQTASTVSDFSSAADARIGAASINALSDVIITTPSNTQVLKYNGTNWVNDTDATGGGGISDGDKGDITVSSSGTVWTVDNEAITLAKQANIATASIMGRTTAATGVQEVLTATQATAILNLATQSLKGLVPAASVGLIVYPSYVSGKSFDAAVNATAPSTIANVSGTIRAYPIFIMRDVTITALRVNCTTLGILSTMRVGLYSMGSTFYPGSLVSGSDVGTIDTSSTGVKTSTFGSAIALTAGYYAVAYNSSATPATMRSLVVGALAGLLDVDETMPTSKRTAWSGTLTYAALPSTFTASLTPTSAAVPQVLFRVQ